MKKPTRMLAVLTRLPVPGSAKTRLIPALGAQGAADLQRAMTARTLRQARFVRATGDAAVSVWFAGGDLARAVRELGDTLPLRPQPEGDLGDRIGTAIEQGLSRGRDRVIVIGCDCPSLDAAALRRAFAALDASPVVLGPAADGGYYLIGMRADLPLETRTAALAGIPWGTGVVLNATLDALREHGVSPVMLPVLSDVDEPADVPACERALAPPRTVSVVVPALNEAASIAATIRSAKARGVEVIVADGESTDGTADFARWAGARVIEAPPGRARQLNTGAAAAAGDALVFLHADTLLPPGFDACVLETLADPDVVLGAFRFSTDLRTPTMRLFESGTNWRATARRMPYGDQALFMRADTFRGLGAFPDLPVMEDFEFVRRARECGRVAIVKEPVVTSGRAWREHGPWRWMLVNRLSATAYRLGVPAARIAAWRGRFRKVR